MDNIFNYTTGRLCTFQCTSLLYPLDCWSVPSWGYPGPQSSYLAIVIPSKSVNSLPSIEIKTEVEMRKMSTYDDICICSYPGGDQSLDITKKYGLRLKPLMQFGHISGFLPTDADRYPYAIQTDIIGTGGSSGSPIVDPSDGKVVGITQNVITSSVSGIATAYFSTTGNMQTNKIFIIGSAKIGLVYGITAYHFMDLPRRIKEFREKGIDYGEINFKSTKFHFLDSYRTKYGTKK